jgi:excisionase family DNA binding protein
MKKPEEQEFLTPEEVAAKLRLNVVVVRRMLGKGILPGRRIGTRVWRTSAAELRDFIASGKKTLSKPGSK